MYDTTTRAQPTVRRRLTTGLAIAGLVGVTITISLFRDAAHLAADSRVPASLTYTIAFVEFEGSTDLSSATFELDVRSWADWRQVQICCGDSAGYVQEWRPDGTMWSGYENWDTGLLLTHQGRPGDLVVPLPDFSQGRPMTRADAAKLSGAVLDEDEAVYWGAVFSLPTAHVVAYRVDGYVSVDGRRTGESTTSHYVFHSALGIPLHHREYQDGMLVRELTVTRLDLGQN